MSQESRIALVQSRVAAVQWKAEVKQWYSDFNSRYFGQELPQDVPIRFSKTLKKALGIAKAKLYPTGAYFPKSPYMDVTEEAKQERWVEVTEIVFSGAYNFTEDQLKSLLLHEMAHVLFYVRHQPYEGHGPEFKKEIARLSSESGLDVPEVESPDQFDLSSDVKRPEVIVMLMKDRNDYAKVISAKLSEEDLYEINRRYGFKFDFYRLEVISELYDFPVRKTYKTALNSSGYRVDPVVNEKVKSEGIKLNIPEKSEV